MHNRFKRLALLGTTLFFVGSLFVASTPPAFAQTVTADDDVKDSALLEKYNINDTFQDKAGLGNQSIRNITASLISVVIGLLGTACVVLVIYAGVTWMTAQGNADKIDTAKKTMANAAIGLVIVLSSYSIVQYFGGELYSATGTGLGVDLFNAEQAGLGSGQNPDVLVGTVGALIVGIMSLVAVVMVMVGGVMWMTSAGNEDRVDTAKKIMRAAFIGLAILLSAYSITNFITSTLVDATGASASGTVETSVLDTTNDYA